MSKGELDFLIQTRNFFGFLCGGAFFQRVGSHLRLKYKEGMMRQACIVRRCSCGDSFVLLGHDTRSNRHIFPVLRFLMEWQEHQFSCKEAYAKSL